TDLYWYGPDRGPRAGPALGPGLGFTSTFMKGPGRELQCLMGLPEATYWLAHYCACVVFSLANSGVILAFMFAYKHETFGVVYLENADPTLLLVSFLLFCFELPLLVLLVSCVTKRGVYAVLLGLVLYTALPLIQLGGFSGIPQSVGEYIFRERAAKLLSSIYPHFALCWVLRITGMENDYSVSPTQAVVSRLFEPAPKNAKVVIVTRELRKHFGQQKALDGVDIEVYENQVTLLLGHNGAGKTTLMSILTGILNPSGGVAVVCGYDVVKNTALARSSIGLCQQTSVFFPDLTVREHLVYFGKVVILDEPTAGLDVENKRGIWDLLLGMRSKSTLILSTHDMEEADILADRIIVMADGRALCSGSPAFLKKAYENDVAIAGSVSGTRPGAARQLGALLTKRVIFFFQSHFLILLIFLTPALLFLVAFDGNRERLFGRSVITQSLPLSMKTLYSDAHTFAQHDVAAKDYFDQYRPLLESEDARLRIFENATKSLLTEAQEDYVAFSQAYLLGGVLEGKRPHLGAKGSLLLINHDVLANSPKCDPGVIMAVDFKGAFDVPIMTHVMCMLKAPVVDMGEA
ncbi:hypothetical protein HPB47_013140, partial [Ixodes persulcatus]